MPAYAISPYIKTVMVGKLSNIAFNFVRNVGDSGWYSPVPNCRGPIKEGRGLAKMAKNVGKFLKLSMGVCKVGVKLLIVISCE